jgi:mannose-6-phosphate isomerase-like protein (cupin superfamily)
MFGQTSQMSASNWQEWETLWYLGGRRIIEALDMQVKQTGTIFENLVPARTSVFAYGPQPEDTAFYVIEGEATFCSGEATIRATPGTFLFLPRPVGFRYSVPASGHVRILTWTTPLGFAQQVTNMGDLGQAFVLSPPPTFESEKVEQLATILRAWLRKGSEN